MRAKRLLKLADHLDTVPRKTFDMADWKCGATACAFGHACSIPAFKRLGLKMVQEYYLNDPELDQHTTDITFGDLDGFDAAESFFDISSSASVYLFTNQRADGKSETPKMVAKRIRRFVDEGDTPKWVKE